MKIKVIGWLPLALQARFRVWSFQPRGRTRSHSTSWRINAYRGLRESAKIGLRDAKTIIDRYAPYE